MDHKPDFTNSEPAVTIGPFPQWKKIVSIDPLGHLSPWLFSDIMRDENIHIRPSIAITKAVRISKTSIFPFGPDIDSWDTSWGLFHLGMHRGLIYTVTKSNTNFEITIQHMKLPELEQSVRDGRIVPDKKICLNDLGELAVTKFAVEPVWYLPGVAERFGIGMTFIRHRRLNLDIDAFLKHMRRLTSYQRKGLCVGLCSRTQEGPFPSL